MKTLEKPICLNPSLRPPKKENQRYIIEGALGKGGLGVVSRGHDTKLDRKVAIKRLRLEHVDNSIPPDTLLREALMLASLNHPNIVSVYDFYEEDREICIVMELLEGKSLDHSCGESKFTMEQFSELVQQTLEALLAAYSANIVHGDIKPQNIVKIDNPHGRDQYKLLDFDQSHFVDTKISPASAHSTYGSIYYMAPELFEGTAPTHASDIYSMGAVYYHALTGQHPCQGNTTIEIMAAHLRHDIIPLNELRPDLPEWLGQWVHWLLSRKPTERPRPPRAVKEFLHSSTPAPQQLLPDTLKRSANTGSDLNMTAGTLIKTIKSDNLTHAQA